jgi:hypothetical protein
MIAVSLGAIASSVIFLPLARQAFEKPEAKDAQRVNDIFANGLSPCDGFLGEVDLQVHQYVPGEPTTSITVFPPFSRAQAIRVVGGTLFYIVLDFPHYTKVADRPQIYSARLSNPTSQALATLLSNDIHQARAERREVMDGTSYIFKSGAKGCAMTTSPDPATRAGKFVALFQKLEKHAKLKNATAVNNSDLEILKAVRSLQDPVSGR